MRLYGIDSVCVTATSTDDDPPRNRSRSPSARLRADARRNRERVLMPPASCSPQHGLDAQMEEIAHAGRVGVGTVYRHFPTKDDLVEALADERFRPARGAARASASRATTPGRRFSEFMVYSAEVQAADRALSEVMAERPEVMRGVAAESGLWEPCRSWSHAPRKPG